MIGKLAITSSYGAIYVFTAEQFPTVIRNVGLGASSTFARIGGVIAPYVNHLVRYSYHIFFSVNRDIQSKQCRCPIVTDYIKSSN